MLLSLSGGLVLSLVIAFLVAFAPDHIAGPVLLALMLPWGIVGWAFPPAQASRLVALAPELAHLTMPLNVSAMYFGIASGSLIGAQVMAFLSVSWLAFIASALLVVTIAVLVLDRRPVPGLAPG